MPQPLFLPSELTIYAVGELKLQWLAWLHATLETGATDAACHVDAAAVDEVDAAGVQLLVSLSHGLARSRLTLQLTDPSDPLSRACEALGVGHLLASTQARGACA
jgi:ABC-type transporter Mla MlaB component